MPPSRLGVKDSSAYNSDESAKRAYYDNTLSSWLFPMRSQFNLKLRSQTEKRLRSRVIEHDVRPWLFADTQTVADMAVKLVGAGIYASDEVRGWFGDSPLADGAGAKVRIPLNTAVAGTEQPPPGDTEPPAKKSGRRTARKKASE
jgi:phage portal protein BeeE